jgi:hypothetical protein
MFWIKKTEESSLDSTMVELGREIERGLILYYSLVTNHWEKMEGSAYHQGINMMMEKILGDKILTNSERMDEANKGLEFSKKYRNQINKAASNYEKFIETRLTQFEEMLEPLLKEKTHDKEKEWIKLSRDLCKIRKSQIAAINIHIDTDVFIPTGIIRDKGNPDREMTEEENQNFAEKLATYATLRKAAHDDENKIEPSRSNLAKSMFGKLSDYMEGGSYTKLLDEVRY